MILMWKIGAHLQSTWQMASIRKSNRKSVCRNYFATNQNEPNGFYYTLFLPFISFDVLRALVIISLFLANIQLRYFEYKFLYFSYQPNNRPHTFRH